MTFFVVVFAVVVVLAFLVVTAAVVVRTFFVVTAVVVVLDFLVEAAVVNFEDVVEAELSVLSSAAEVLAGCDLLADEDEELFPPQPVRMTSAATVASMTAAIDMRSLSNILSTSVLYVWAHNVRP